MTVGHESEKDLRFLEEAGQGDHAMKQAIIISVLLACLAGTAQANLTMSFDFDDVASPYGAAQIESYMEGLYPGRNITVTGATSYGSGGPIGALYGGGADRYIGDDGTGLHEFSISFDLPITSVSFDWASQTDAFNVFAGDGTGPANDQIFWSAPGTASGSMTINVLGFEDISYGVTTLRFTDHNTGGIGIDNLMVSVVPLPASILLGVFAVGLAVRELRKFV